MRIFFLFSVVFLLGILGVVSCTHSDVYKVARIETISGEHCGYGLVLPGGGVYTLRHVFGASGRGCDYIFIDDHLYTEVGSVRIHGADLVSIGTVRPVGGAVAVGDEIRVGSATGTILSLSGNSVGYTDSLDMVLLTGAIVTDILLDPGMSGFPVMNGSGLPIGLYTSVDRTEGKGYIIPIP